MELRHLRYFVAVAEEHSFVRAARSLYISQSAISEQIADLEREVGVALLMRGARKTTLTESGQLFYEHAQSILQAAETAVREARRRANGETGSLRIGFSTGGVGENFPRLIREFRERHAGVEMSLLEMTSSGQWQALREGRLDIGFTREPDMEFRHDLQYEGMQMDPIIAMLPQSHRLASQAAIDLRDLSGERFVLSSREVSPTVWEKVMGLCMSAGFTPKIGSISSVWSSVAMMVKAGEGVALLPANQQQTFATGLAFLPLRDDHATIELMACWPAHRTSPLLESFLELAREYSLSGQRF